jgi:hypothetical protein
LKVTSPAIAQNWTISTLIEATSTPLSRTRNRQLLVVEKLGIGMHAGSE